MSIFKHSTVLFFCCLLFRPSSSSVYSYFTSSSLLCLNEHVIEALRWRAMSTQNHSMTLAYHSNFFFQPSSFSEHIWIENALKCFPRDFWQEMSRMCTKYFFKTSWTSIHICIIYNILKHSNTKHKHEHTLVISSTYI